MKVPASTILSFVTGRLYSTKPPTVLFGPMLSFLTGQQAVFTHMLPDIKNKYSGNILIQCPHSFAKVCNMWTHTEDWEQRVKDIDSYYGEIELTPFNQNYVV